MLGARIRALRLAHGWTQAQLAARVQVTPTYISMLERGHTVHPTAPVLGHRAGVLSVRLPHLLDETRPLDALPLALPSALAADADLNRLIQAWARISPAWRPHLVELANTLASISALLDNPADANRALPDSAAHPVNTSHE